MPAPSQGALDQPWVRWVIAVVLVGHGVLHALGPVEIWGVTDVPELTGIPSIPLGETATTMAAAGWLIASVVLVAAGWGVVTGRAWWRRAALVGVLVSQLVVLVWWSDAATGTIPNLLVVAALLATRPSPATGQARSVGTRRSSRSTTTG